MDGSVFVFKCKKMNLFIFINIFFKGCKFVVVDDEFDDDLGIKEEMDMDIFVKKLKFEVDVR